MVNGWKRTISKTKKKITYKKGKSEIIVGKTYEGFWIVIINKDFKKSFTKKTNAINYINPYMRSH